MTSRDEARAKALEDAITGAASMTTLTPDALKDARTTVARFIDESHGQAKAEDIVDVAIRAYLAAAPSDAPAGGDAPAIWLKADGQRIVVSLLVGEKETLIISEPRDGEISHIVEPQALRRLIREPKR